MTECPWQTAGDERCNDPRSHGFRGSGRLWRSRSTSVTHSLVRMRRVASRLGGSFVFRERIVIRSDQ